MLTSLLESRCSRHLHGRCPRRPREYSGVRPLSEKNVPSCACMIPWCEYENPHTSGCLLVRENKNMYCSFSSNKEPLVLLLYLISIVSCKVTHTGSIHKYTQLAMLTHYSPLRGWLPSVTFGHKQNETHPTLRTGACGMKWQMYPKLPPHAPKGARSQDRHLTLSSLWLPSAATTRKRSEKEIR